MPGSITYPPLDGGTEYPTITPNACVGFRLPRIASFVVSFNQMTDDLCELLISSRGSSIIIEFHPDQIPLIQEALDGVVNEMNAHESLCALLEAEYNTPDQALA